jgi:hypothetical protein
MHSAAEAIGTLRHLKTGSTAGDPRSPRVEPMADQARSAVLRHELSTCPATPTLHTKSARGKTMRTIFRNCSIWDGTGSAAYTGDVLVVGNRIETIFRSRGDLPVAGAQVIDAECDVPSCPVW